MNISREDAGLFFKLMWALQAYINRQLKLVPGIKSTKSYIKLDSEEKLKVRNALWAHPELLEAFLIENPARLSPEEIQIVTSWKRHIAGRFYILRFLKRYAIFLSADEGECVYGVLGLYDALEDVMVGWPLPILVEAVLLPFKGRIVYDGLVIPYSISFGSGIRGDLNEIFQRTKQAGQIVETLEWGVLTRKAPKAKKPKRDWRPVLDHLVETTEQLHQAEDMVQTRAFGLLKASARLAQVAAHDPKNLDELNGLSRRVAAALRQLDIVLDRAEYSFSDQRRVQS